MHRPHTVPLSAQAITLLQQIKVINPEGYLFAGLTGNQPMSENTLGKALWRAGYLDRQTGHGFRHLISTELNERGYNSDWIEVQLAHKVSPNKIRATYNHADYLEDCRRMMQAWANLIEASQTAGWKECKAMSKGKIYQHREMLESYEAIDYLSELINEKASAQDFIEIAIGRIKPFMRITIPTFEDDPPRWYIAPYLEEDGKRVKGGMVPFKNHVFFSREWREEKIYKNGEYYSIIKGITNGGFSELEEAIPSQGGDTNIIFHDPNQRLVPLLFTPTDIQALAAELNGTPPTESQTTKDKYKPKGQQQDDLIIMEVSTRNEIIRSYSPSLVEISLRGFRAWGESLAHLLNFLKDFPLAEPCKPQPEKLEELNQKIQALEAEKAKLEAENAELKKQGAIAGGLA